MGMPGPCSKSSYDLPRKCEDNRTESTAIKGNPVPTNFVIQELTQIGEYTVVRVKYPDSYNYEGTKILVYKASIETFQKRTSLDPHFSDNTKELSPIARFEPTTTGWIRAMAFCNMLNTLNI